MSIGGFTDPVSIGGFTDQADPAARAEHRRQQRLRIAHRAGWAELERRNLLFQPFGIVIHEPSGDSYHITRGEPDVQYSPIVAYFIDPNGDPVFLERR